MHFGAPESYLAFVAPVPELARWLTAQEADRNPVGISNILEQKRIRREKDTSLLRRRILPHYLINSYLKKIKNLNVLILLYFMYTTDIDGIFNSTLL